MDQISSSPLAQRLERYRAQTRPAVVPTGRGASTDADLLAGAVGGRVEELTVVVDSWFDVELDRAQLARLPYGVPAGPPLVALDTETTGLATAAGTVAFLVGVGTWERERLRVRQFLLPDHAVESSFLTKLADAIPADAWLVTYNGRSFDWPLLTARYRLHRRPPPATAGHLDLLHIARALWKHRLGNARLATVEHEICDVRRFDDLPGSLIPDRYFRYLRDRRGEQLRPVVEHNRQDVASLALLLRVLGGLADPSIWTAGHPGDVAALGRSYARSGERATALDCFEAALGSSAWEVGVVGGGPLWRRVAMDRARLLARLGRVDESIAAWLEIARRGGPGAAAAWLHIARHREHVERDVVGALNACAQALASTERARLWGRPVPAIERDLAWRMARLRRRASIRPAERAA